MNLPGNDDEQYYGAAQDFYSADSGESALGELDALDDYAPTQSGPAGTDPSTGELNTLDDYSPDHLDPTEQTVDELDALDDYVPEHPEQTETNLDDIDLPTEDEDDEVSGPLFTVTNPAETVSVSAFMDGSIHQVELSAKTTSMTESELAAEIVVIAQLAQQNARSAQHNFILEKMTEAGADDTDAVREVLREGMRLPTPEQAAAAQAEVFATRYQGTQD